MLDEVHMHSAEVLLNYELLEDHSANYSNSQTIFRLLGSLHRKQYYINHRVDSQS